MLWNVHVHAYTHICVIKKINASSIISLLSFWLLPTSMRDLPYLKIPFVWPFFLLQPSSDFPLSSQSQPCPARVLPAQPSLPHYSVSSFCSQNCSSRRGSWRFPRRSGQCCFSLSSQIVSSSGGCSAVQCGACGHSSEAGLGTFIFLPVHSPWTSLFFFF